MASTMMIADSSPSSSSSASAATAVEQANALMTELMKIERQSGVLILNSHGQALAATGDLTESDRYAPLILYALMDARGLLDHSDCSTDSFRKLTVAFQHFQFVITMHHQLIIAIKLVNDL